MKIKFIVFLTLTLMVLLIPTSCNSNEFDEFQMNFLSEEEKVIKIFDKMSKNMDSLDSYSASSIAEFNMMLNEKPMIVEIDAKIEYQRLDGDIVYNENLTASTEYDGVQDGYESSKGFQKGRMYHRHCGDGADFSIFSPISASDFIAYLSEQDTIDGVDFEVSNFENSSIEEENGNRKLVFSGLLSSGESEKLSDEMNLSLISDYLVIEDLVLTVLVSEDYYCQEMIIEPVFGLKETDDDISAPTMKITTKYTDLNATEARTWSIDEYKEFVEVYDLRVLHKISRALCDLYKAENISFEYTGYKPASESNVKKVQEIDTVEYSLKDGKPTYVIFSTIPDIETESTITYSSGKKIVTLGNVANTIDSDDRTEKQFIRSLMFPLGIDTNYVYDISESEPGVYLLSFKTSNDQRKQVQADLPYGIENMEFYISITYEDGIIKKYTTQVELSYVRNISSNAVMHGKSYSSYDITELSYDTDK